MTSIVSFVLGVVVGMTILTIFAVVYVDRKENKDED